MLLTGTPGIGKSLWLIYLLIKLAKLKKTVVLEMFHKPSFVVKFSRQDYFLVLKIKRHNC